MQILAAITGLANRLDDTGAEYTASIRSDLAALDGTLATVAGTCEQHDRRLGATTDTVTTLSAAVAALRLETLGERARRAQTRRIRALGDLVNGTASLGIRIGNFGATSERHRTD